MDIPGGRAAEHTVARLQRAADVGVPLPIPGAREPRVLRADVPMPVPPAAASAGSTPAAMAVKRGL